MKDIISVVLKSRNFFSFPVLVTTVRGILAAKSTRKEPNMNRSRINSPSIGIKFKQLNYLNYYIEFHLESLQENSEQIPLSNSSIEYIEAKI